MECNTADLNGQGEFGANLYMHPTSLMLSPKKVGIGKPRPNVLYEPCVWMDWDIEILSGTASQRAVASILRGPFIVASVCLWLPVCYIHYICNSHLRQSKKANDL